MLSMVSATARYKITLDMLLDFCEGMHACMRSRVMKLQVIRI